MIIQPQFVYSACGPFTRHRERIKKFKQTGDTRYIYRNELDKVCFQHDSAYQIKSDKVLRDKAYNIAKRYVVPLKDKKGISIVNAFNKIIRQSNSVKPNKIWVDQ